MRGQQLKAEIEALFTVVPGRSNYDELVIICPVKDCNDKTGNRSVNLKNGATNCWRCGKASRNFIQFAKRLGYEMSEDVAPVISAGEADKLLESLDNDRHKILVPVSSDCKLPRGFIECREEKDSVYTRLIGKMAVKKNLELRDMFEAGVGFTRDDPVWEPYAIFPIVEWGRVVYYQGRLYRSEPGQSTKRFPSNKQHALGSKYWVYNIDEVRAKIARTVIVVESILNVLSLRKKLRELRIGGVVPVAVFKHKLSAPQVQKLLMCDHISEIVILYDSDATETAWREGSLLVNKKKVSIAEMPAVPGKPNLDANDNSELAVEAFLKRKPYSQASSLLKTLNTL